MNVAPFYPGGESGNSLYWGLVPPSGLVIPCLPSPFPGSTWQGKTTLLPQCGNAVLGWRAVLGLVYLGPVSGRELLFLNCASQVGEKHFLPKPGAAAAFFFFNGDHSGGLLLAGGFFYRFII